MAVNTAGRIFLETLQRWLKSGVAGGIEWQDGKRRRLVFLEGDTITMVQSNLRSESAERLAHLGPTADLVSATRQVRLRALLAEREGSILVHPGTEPPAREPVPLAVALWEIADALPAPDLDSFPMAVSTAFSRLGALPWSHELMRYLEGLDGTRSIEDVVDFGPAVGAALVSALAVARIVGAIDIARSPSVALRVEPQGAGAGRPSGLFDLGSTEAKAAPLLDDTTDEETIEEVQRDLEAAANHFEVLGVQWQDEPEAIRRAYLGLAARLHPDRWRTAAPEVRERTERLFDIVRGAWETLGDPKKRDAYTRKEIFGELTEEEKANAQLQAVLEAERLLTLGQREVSAQRFPQANELLKLALASDPLHPQVRAYAAYCTIRMNPGKTTPAVEEAVREVEAVARDIPGADWARVLLGRVRLTRGDTAGAQRAFIEALRLNPSNQDATGEMWKLKGQREEKEAEPAGFFSRIFKR